MAYTFQLVPTKNPGTASPVTFSVNLGSGSFFIVMAIFVQGNVSLSSVAINSIYTLSLVAGTGNTAGYQIWSGTATVTGTDSVLVTGASSLAFLDVNIAAWTMSSVALNSSNTAHGGAVTTASLIGDYVFSCTSAVGGSYSASTQAPANTGTITGNNGNVLTVADWIAGAGVSGGNFTATTGGTNDTSIADYTPGGGGSVANNLTGMASAEW